MAITLYKPGLSMRSIAKILNLLIIVVLKWIKSFAKEIYEKPEPCDEILVELDEMWHYLKTKKQTLDLESISTRNWRAY